MKKIIGGQAVIEGVMMKSDKKVAVAVRKKSRIIVKKRNYKSLTERHQILKLPIIRGIIFLFEMLFIGVKSLTWSADQQTGKNERISPFETFFTILLSFALVIVIFIIVPFYITKIFIKETNVIFNLIDGVIRVMIFFLYILVISSMKDIRRVFQYHGAEHKAVYCYEADEKLTVKNVQKYSTLHPRCGTSFIILVLIISILLFSILKDPRWWVNIPFRIFLVPVVAGISYEILRISARYRNNLLFNILIQPGLWFQKITTREPDNKQVEVAIAALKKVI